MLGEAEITTRIPQTKDQELLEFWKADELWPVIIEHATAISGSDDKKSGFHNFCPEVSFDVFHLFAVYLHRFADEIDRDNRHSQLASDPGKHRGDWRWNWEHVEPMHYMDCPVFSALSTKKQQSSYASKPDEIVSLRPGAFGINVNLKALWRKISWRSILNLGRAPAQDRNVRRDSVSAPASDRGLLDFQVDVEEGLSEISGITGEIGSRFRGLNPKIEAATRVLQSSAAATEKRSKLRVPAAALLDYADWLKGANPRYVHALVSIENGINAMFSGEFKVEPNARDSIRGFLSALETMELNARSSRQTIRALVETMDSLPRIEQEFNHAKRALSDQLKEVARNIEKTESLARNSIATARRLVASGA